VDANARHGKKISDDLRERANGPSADQDQVNVILQFRDKPSGVAETVLGRCGAKTKGDYKNFNARAVQMPASAVNDLAALDEVVFISPDREVQSLGHISATTGADLVRSNSSGTGSALDGSGIGIAVLDSGVYMNHASFLDRTGKRRVIVNQTFADGGGTGDDYGHGTHVASIAGGNGRVANASYLGIAPNANILNLRVLNSRGSGTASSVLSAFDWIMANRSGFNIRVVNLSVGMPAVDSYLNDPICRGVRRLVDAGIVVVVAAGNAGKDAAGNKLYGTIQSPGNEPSAITVGATNTFGTDDRSDDTVAT